MDDQQFHQFLDFFGLSWKGYRKVRKGVKKRLTRCMQENEYRSMEAFLTALERNKGQREQVEKLLTVSTGPFFRDRALWESIQNHVLPAVVAIEKERIKVWCAGCARGEEVYSLKILWEEWGRDQDQLPELALWATDMNAELLEGAWAGVYSSSSLRELQAEWRAYYFKPVSETRFAIAG